MERPRNGTILNPIENKNRKLEHRHNTVKQRKKQENSNEHTKNK